MNTIIGYKKGMTQIFKDNGDVLPCTVVDVSQVKVVGFKTKEKDGYNAIVLGVGEKKKPTKAEIGKFSKIKFVPKKSIEVRVKEEEELKNVSLGEEVKLDHFKEGTLVNVSGTTKGKGFQGVVKRWGFKGGKRTRGQSDRQRHPGSIGAGTSPGRVFRGKKMAGHMGNRKKTVKNLEVVKIDAENKLIFLKGAIPGKKDSLVKIFYK